MARVTVEDCVKVIESRFELILVAAERSRILSKGAEPLLDRDRDKNPVVALREIAENKLDLEQTSSFFFTVRPSHTLRYGFKTRNSYLGNIPILRELFVTGVSFTLKFKK